MALSIAFGYTHGPHHIPVLQCHQTDTHTHTHTHRAKSQTEAIQPNSKLKSTEPRYLLRNLSESLKRQFTWLAWGGDKQGGEKLKKMRVITCVYKPKGLATQAHTSLSAALAEEFVRKWMGEWVNYRQLRFV